MEGAIPPALEGMLVRNGPNPAVRPRPRPLPLVQRRRHGARRGAARGRAVSYRNRWVQTRKLSAEVGTAYPRGPAEPIDGPANTHVLWHGGRLLALCETGFPHRLDTAMATIEVEDFDGALTSPMTAHPHADPGDRGLAFFGYDVFGPPYLRYHELDAAGELVHSTDVEIPRATMQHDFGVTASRVAFLDLPVVFDRDLAARRRRPSPSAGAPRPAPGWACSAGAATGTDDRWCGIDPCYVFHVVNAFDDGPAVVLDVCRYDHDVRHRAGRAPVARPSPPSSAGGSTRRPAGDDHRRSTTAHVEFPRIDDTLAGRPYRYAYCTELVATEGTRGSSTPSSATTWPATRRRPLGPRARALPGRAGLRARPRRAGRRRGVGADRRLRRRHRRQRRRGPRRLGVHRRPRGGHPPPGPGALRLPRQLGAGPLYR